MKPRLPSNKNQLFRTLLVSACVSVLLFGFFQITQAQSNVFFNDPLGLNAKDSAPEDTVNKLAIRVVSALLTFVGVLSFIMFVYAGINWMIFSGNETKITESKNTMLWAVIGLLVVFLSYAILSMIIDTLQDTFDIQEPTRESTK